MYKRQVTLSVPCADPANISTSPVGVDKAKLNWTPTTGAWQHLIRWREQGGSWNQVLKNGDKTFHWLNGLSANTTYEWQIRTACNPDRSSNTPWSAVQTFTTAATMKTALYNNRQQMEPTLLVYPNPATDRVSIYVANPDASGFLELRLFDATGKMVRAVSGSLATGELSTTMQVSGLAPGIYMLHAQGAASFTKRLVIE